MPASKKKAAPAPQPAKPTEPTIYDLDKKVNLTIVETWKKRLALFDEVIGHIEKKDKAKARALTLELAEELNQICAEKLLDSDQYYKTLYGRLISFYSDLDNLVWDFAAISASADSIRQDIYEIRDLVKSRRSPVKARV